MTLHRFFATDPLGDSDISPVISTRKKSKTQHTADGQLDGDAMYKYGRVLATRVPPADKPSGAIVICTPYTLASAGLVAYMGWKLKSPYYVADALMKEAKRARVDTDKEPPGCWLVPVHLPNHWALMVIRGCSRVVETADSLSGYQPDTLNAAAQAVAAALNTVWPSPAWTVRSCRVPQQRDSVSCGVYVLCFMRTIVDALALPGQRDAFLTGGQALHEMLCRVTMADVSAERVAIEACE